MTEENKCCGILDQQLHRLSCALSRHTQHYAGCNIHAAKVKKNWLSHKQGRRIKMNQKL